MVSRCVFLLACARDALHHGACGNVDVAWHDQNVAWCRVCGHASGGSCGGLAHRILSARKRTQVV